MDYNTVYDKLNMASALKTSFIHFTVSIQQWQTPGNTTYHAIHMHCICITRWKEDKSDYSKKTTGWQWKITLIFATWNKNNYYNYIRLTAFFPGQPG